MTTGILIIAHSPLASALRHCVQHVHPDMNPPVVAFDVHSAVPVEQTQAEARAFLAGLPYPQVLVMTDLFGSTPFNVAQKIVDGVSSRLVVGVNLPMVLRAVNYRHEPLESLVRRAIDGAIQGVLQVSTSAPQNQGRKRNDQDNHDHQQ